MLDGAPVHRLGDAARARLRAHRFGFVFQDAALDASRAVLDNVIETALYRGQRRRHAIDRAGQLLERFGVELRASHKPGEISGGQAQRIALCRALLGEPDIVLADEPTGNLDPSTRDVVVDALHEHAAAGACVVIATHDPTVANSCDQHIELGELT
jgi:ABC-type lipoprotein export system ATPase subunit